MVQSVERAFRLLSIIAEENSIGLLDLSRRTNLPPSTVHRLLLALMQLDYVNQDPENERYRVGSKVIQLAKSSLDSMDIRTIARPFIRELVERTNETAHLVILSDRAAVCIESIETGEQIRMCSPVGAANPLHCSSVGKVLMAYQPEDVQDALLAGTLERFTEHTIVSREEIKEQLKIVREAGVAFDNEEHLLGARCLAAPVFNHHGEVVAAIGISGPTVRVIDAKLPIFSAYVKEAAAKITQNYVGV